MAFQVDIPVASLCGSPLATVQAAWILLVAKYEGNDSVFLELELEGGRHDALPLKTEAEYDVVSSRPVAELVSQLEASRPVVISYHGNGTQGLMGSHLAGSKSRGGLAFKIVNKAFHPLATASSSHAAACVLTIAHVTDSGSVTVTLEDQTALADLTQLHRYLQQLRCTVQSFIAYAADGVLADIDIMASADVESVLRLNNDLPVPIEATLHDMVSQRGKANPSKMAVEGPDGSLSYAELERLSDALATHLRSLGLGKGELASLRFEKSLWNVVSTLAVLKAGAGFVPIDPGTPLERTRTMLATCAPKVNLVSASQAAVVEQLELMTLVVDERCVAFTNIQPKDAFDLPISLPSNVAYIIFTSGTTGIPKGTITEHRGIVTTLVALSETVDIRPETRLLQFASHAFDVSILEMFVTLMAGATLCIPSEEERFEDVGSLIQKMELTCAIFTPSYVRATPTTSFQGLRTLLIGAEAIQPRDLSEKLSVVDHVYGLYGPSETSCVTTVVHFNTESVAHDNMGHTIGCIGWVVDRSDYSKLQPIGTVGELVLEGPAVGRGYLHDFVKTKSVFVDPPQWLSKMRSGSCGQLYCTGDLVRLHADGSLQFVGRKDSQVKLRGMRIELGEIEYHICEAIGDSFDVAVDTASLRDGSDAIIGYLVSKTANKKAQQCGILVDPETLEKAQTILRHLKPTLAKILPDYMIPSALCMLSGMPRTIGGKLDRKALRSWASTHTLARLSGEYDVDLEGEAPRTEMQLALCDAWSSVLGLSTSKKLPDQAPPALNLKSNFFSWGANSLSAIRLSSILRSKNLSLSVKQVFENPTLKSMADSISSMDGESDHSAISPFSLIDNAAAVLDAAAHACAVDKADIDDIFPCTPFQQGVLADSMYQKDAYFIQQHVSLPNNVSIGHFEESWETIARQEFALRTRCIETDAGMMQVLVSYNASCMNLRKNTGSLKEYLRIDHEKPMELGQPLARAVLVEDQDQSETTFVLSMHHAVSDRWSATKLIQRLEQCIHGLAYEPCTNPALLAKYIKQLSTPQMEGFWKNALENCTAPTFPQIPSQKDFKPLTTRCIRETFESDVGNDVDTTLTTASYIRAAWALTVASYSGFGSDAVFGTTVSGRTAPVPGIDHMSGPSIATIPSRIQLPPLEYKTLDFIRDVQAEFASASTYEQIGLKAIARVSSDASAAVQFQNLLSIEVDVPSEGVHGKEDLVSRMTTEFMSTNYSLVLNVFVTGAELIIDLSFDDRVLSEHQTRNIHRQFEHYYHQLRNGRCQSIDDLSHLNTYDSSVLSQWSGTLPELIHSRIEDLILTQVKEQPGAEALASWDGNMTYQELEETSSSLAKYLHQVWHLRPGDIVPYCFEKSIRSIVVMLAIIKTGAAITAIDPTWPIERTEKIFRHCEAKICVAGSATLASLQDCQIPILVLDDATLQIINDGTITEQITETNPADAVIVQYTSGSTGEPKGIVLSHEALATSITAHAGPMHFEKGTRVLQFANFTYDVSVSEIFTTLSTGGCVCIPSEAERFNDLPGAINRLGVTWTFQTPTMALVLRPEQVPRLKYIYMGGEAPTSQSFQIWADALSLGTCYGPAETSIYTNCRTAVKVDDDPADAGQPFSACRFWIVHPNDHNRLLPIGAVGEVVIEGPIVTNGYFRDSSTTKAHFIEPPTWAGLHGESTRGRKFYKTGDLAKFGAEGSLLVHGRKDSQIKIRGRRVEIGEVEYQLQRSMPTKTDVAVELARADEGKAAPAIVAFIVTTGGEDNGMHELISTVLKRLEATLPHHMVPTIFLPVDRIPLTDGGKTNRRKLREIVAKLSLDDVAHLSRTSREHRAPTTSLQKLLQSIWAVQLGVQAEIISLDDNFFRIGGDSISAMRLVSKARQQGLHFSVQDIFENPTLEDLARSTTSQVVPSGLQATDPFSLISVAQKDAWITQMQEDFAIQPAQVQDMYPPTPLQEGLWALSQQNNAAYHAQIVIDLGEIVDISRFNQVWSQMIQRFNILRTRFAVFDGKLMQVVLNDVSDIVHEKSALEQHLQADRSRPFQLGGPLHRFTLLQSTTDDRHHLVWATHHSLYDGHLLGLLFSWFDRAYRGETEQEDSLVQFSSYIREVSNLHDSDEFWKSYLDSEETQSFPKLPSIDHTVRPSAQAHTTFTLPPRLNEDLTVPSLLRAAWSLVCSRWLDADDVSFAGIVSGRSSSIAGADAVAGPTLATIPVRIQIGAETTVAEFLRSVHSDAVKSLPHEHYGLQRISRLSTNAANACDVQSSLVVHSKYQTRDRLQGPLGLRYRTGDASAFYTYALNLECSLLKDNQIEISAYFDDTVLPRPHARRVLGQFAHVANQLAQRESHYRVRDISLLTEADKDEIYEWNKEVPHRVQECLTSLVSAGATAHPNDIAVVTSSVKLTYRELDTFSTKYAQYLIELGTRTSTRVLFCLEKSELVPVWMLALLKAGSVVVPIDPTHPHHRVCQIADSTGASVTVTSEKHAAKYRDVTCNMINISQIPMEWTPQTSTALPKIHPGDEAFVFSTSGSTGLPKAIIKSHAMIATGMTHQVARWNLAPGSRVLQFASHTFPIWIAESFGAFLSQSSLCVPTETERLQELGSFMQRHHVTASCLTTTVARMLEPSKLPSMNTLIVAGEPASPELVALWGSSVRLLNAYGVTEACGACCISPPKSTGSAPANFGRGYSCLTWVVEKSNPRMLAGIGTVGELVLQGHCVAKGYLNDAQRSDAVFIDPPRWLTERPGHSLARLYRTGDLVRYAPDGTLEYICRIDADEIKIRGQRVALTDIESNLRACLSPQSNVAVDFIHFKGDPSGPRLTAFVEGLPADRESGQRLEIIDTLPEVRAKLLQRLPAYMCPSLYFRVPCSLPTTVSFKLDRKTLKGWAAQFDFAQIARHRNPDTTVRRSPQKPKEKQLQHLWSDLLGISSDQIGLDDSFIQLGGDSVLAMLLSSKARDYQLSLPVTEIIRNPTLHEMAEASTDSSQGQPIASLDLIQPFGLLGDPSEVDDKLTGLLRDHTKLSKADVEDIYPCTSMQSGLLAATSEDPSSYLSSWTFALPDTIGLQTLRLAWMTVASHHAMLRTRIVQIDDRFFQVVGRRTESIFSDSSDNIKGCGREMFSIQLSPSDDGNTMTIFGHHAAFDSWSMPRLMDNLARAYHKSSLLRVVEYRHFVNYALSQVNDEGRRYWENLLAGAGTTEFPEIPTTHRPRTNAFARHSFNLSGPSTSGVTLASMIRGAWTYLISKHAMTSDVVIGVVSTGRAAPVAGIEQVDGPTLISLPARTVVEENMPVSDFLSNVQQQSLDALPFEQYGLQNIRRINDQMPALCQFRTLFVFQNLDVDWGAPLGLSSVANDGGESHPQAINLQCKTAGGIVTLEANYDDHVVKEVEMGRYLKQLETIVHAFNTADAKAKLSDVQLLNPDDFSTLERWNVTLPTVVEDCMHSVIERNVRKRPSAPAISAWDGDLTYLELDTAATRLARYLVDNFQVRPDEVIPLWFEKSMWTAVAMYAVQKAGCAYALMGLYDPHHRIDHLVKSTGARLILCSRQQAQKASALDVESVVIDNSFISQLLDSNTTLKSDVRSHNLAYILFTSGSTGTPKAVMIEHGAGVTSAYEHGRVECVTEESRVFQFAAYTFDVSTSETLTTLIWGGCVCIPSEDERLADLAGSINRFNVNHAFLTPTVVSLLDPSEIPRVRVLKLGGEALTRDNVAIWADKVQLSNSYGVCEAAIRSCFRNYITPDTDFTNCGSAVGCALWIVDPANYHRLLPIGATGELLIEGPCLARGYLGDSEKTVAAFVSPSWLKTIFPTRQARVYRTGDLVKYAPDGTIRFVGRSDTQVKVHGQRIELREIEHHITTLVKTGLGAVSVPRSGPLRGKLVGLVAFSEALLQEGNLKLLKFSQSKEVLDTMGDMETKLSEKLPAHMIPHTWLAVNGLPINQSGKLDRMVLSKWIVELDEDDIIESQQVTTQEAGMLPEGKEELSPTEECLQEIWTKVLNISRTNIVADASFARLGGDSISAMQVAGMARARGIKIRMLDILNARSLASLASQVSSGSASLPAKEPSPRLNAPNVLFPVSPIQQMFFDQSPKGRLAYHQAKTVRLKREVDDTALGCAMRTLVQRHPMLRAKFRRDNSGGWRQIVSDFDESCFSHEQICVAGEADILEALHNRQQQLNSSHGPVFVSTSVCWAGSRYLHLAAHHLVMDLVSLRILLQELEELLLGHTLSPNWSLPYQQWCHMQRELAVSDSPDDIRPCRPMEDEEGFWAMEELPNQMGDVISESFTLSESATSAILHQDEQTSGVTQIDVLMGALAFNLHNIFGDELPLTIYNEGHGREFTDENVDLSGTVGWFATRCPINIDHSCSSILQSIRSAAVSRRQAQENGRRWFACRMFHPEGQRRFGRHRKLGIALNYHGLIQQLEGSENIFESADLEPSSHPDDLERFALIEVDAAVSHGKLTIVIEWNRRMRHQMKLRRWTDECRNTLLNATDWCGDLQEHTVSVNDDSSGRHLLEGTKELHQAVLSQGNFPSTVQVVEAFPLTPMQDSMLLAKWRDGHSYRVCLYMLASPKSGLDLDLGRLETAWRQVVERHASLRTMLLDVGTVSDRTLQVVLSNVRADVVTRYAKDQQDAIARHDPTISTASVGSIEQCMTIYQLASGEAVCAFEISHAFIDAWSNSILIRDLAEAYNGAALRPAPSLGEFVRFLSEEHVTNNLAYWKHHLQDAKPTSISSDVPDSKERQHAIIDVPLTNLGFRQFCKDHAITPAIFFQTVYALVLRIFTGRTEVLFGYLGFGRDIPVDGIEETVGAFITMLICCRKIRASTTFEQLLKDQQKTTMEQMGHQHFSLAHLHHELNLKGLPLFNTILSVHGEPKQYSDDDSIINVEAIEMNDVNEYALSVNVLHGEAGSHLNISFATDTLSKADAEYISHTFVSVAGSIIGDPEGSLGDWSLSTMSKRCNESPKSDSLKTTSPGLTHDAATELKCTQEFGESSSNNRLADQFLDADQQRSMNSRSVLKQIWAKVLNVSLSTITDNESFFRLGGDSISAMKVASESRKHGVRVTVKDILTQRTINKLAAVAKAVEPTVANLQVQPNQGTTESDRNNVFGFTAIQQMHLRRDPNLQYRFNQSVLLQAPQLNVEQVRDAFRGILQRRPMLRVHLTSGADGFQKQRISSDLCHSFDCQQAILQDARALDDIIEECQSTVSFRSGINLAARIISSQDRCLLFLTANHFCVDLVSWRLILADLEEYLTTGSISSPTGITPYSQWAESQLSRTADNRADQPSPLENHLEYWMPSKPIITHEDLTSQKFTLTKSASRLITGASGIPFDAQPVDVMISAVLYSFSETFTDRQIPTLHFEGHGRVAGDSNLDVSDTVGWFTTIHPFLGITASDQWTLVRQIKRSREADGEAGLTSFCRAALPSTSRLGIEPVELLFNYAGAFQQLEKPDALLRETQDLRYQCRDVDPQLPRFSLFTVEAEFANGQLTMELIFNSLVKHKHLIAKWWSRCEARLSEIAEAIEHRRPFNQEQTQLAALPQSKDLADATGLRDQVSHFMPVSPIQEHMLALEAGQPGSCSTYIAFEVHGLQDYDSLRSMLEHAWRETVAQNDILRTNFCKGEDGTYRAFILQNFLPDVLYAQGEKQSILEDLEHGPARILDDDCPPHEMVLYRTKEETCFAVLHISHLLTDAGSRAPLFKALTAALNGRPVPSGPSYAKNIASLDKTIAKSKSHWDALANALEPCLLATDRNATCGDTMQSKTKIDIPSTAELHKLCGKLELTIPQIFNIAWSIVLLLRTSSPTVCYQYITSIRREEDEGEEEEEEKEECKGEGNDARNMFHAIGPYYNLLLGTVPRSTNMTIRSVVEGWRESFLEGLPYQNVPIVVGPSLTNTLVNFMRLPAPSHESVSRGKQRQDELWIDEISAGGRPEHDFVLSVIERQRDDGAQGSRRSELRAELCCRTAWVSDSASNAIARLVEKVLARMTADVDAALADM